MSLLESAQSYARRGWSIVPVKFHEGRKQGAVRWKPYQSVAPEPARLSRWFSSNKYPALAVVLGPVSGNLACRDFDKAEAYERWAKAHPDLAKQLPTVQTGRGFHVYFIAPVEKTLHFGDGELRGAKSLCVLPPSPHPNGGAYRWIVELPAGRLPEIDPAQAGLIPLPMQQKQTEANRMTTEANRRSSSAEGVKGTSPAKDEIENAIAATLPTGPGRRNQQVFQFARALKGIPALAGASADSLRSYVQRWHQQALRYITTQDVEETWIDFLMAWPKITRPLRINLLENAMKDARAYPIPDLPYESSGVRNLVALCRELQRIVGDQPFWLSARSAGRLLHVYHVTAWRWLYLLEHDGWIKTIEKGSAKTRQATRFRYHDLRAKAV